MENTYAREQVTAAVQRAVDLILAAGEPGDDNESLTVLDLMATAVDRVLTDPEATFAQVFVADLTGKGFNATIVPEGREKD